MGFQSLVTLMDKTSLVLAGEPVTYTPGVGSPVTVKGMFDALYEYVPAGNAGVASIGPMVGLRMADLTSDPTVDSPTVTIGSTTYQVRDAQPDGKGFVRLFLHEVA